MEYKEGKLPEPTTGNSISNKIVARRIVLLKAILSGIFGLFCINEVINPVSMRLSYTIVSGILFFLLGIVSLGVCKRYVSKAIPLYDEILDKPPKNHDNPSELQEGSETRTIYVELLDEGTKVARPTQGLLLQGDVYRILPTPDYNPNIERWEFPPDSIVRCTLTKRECGEILLACELVPSNKKEP